MIYLDTSVVVAHLLVEDRMPSRELWDEELTSSRLTEYESWTRLHRSGFAKSHGDELRGLLSRVAFVELSPHALARALEPFPVPVRTLDALHLASMEFLRASGQAIEVASYDDRLVAAARKLRFAIRKV